MGHGRRFAIQDQGDNPPPTRSTSSAVPFVQPVHRAWGKLSWDLSETTWKSNGGTNRWQSWRG